MVLNLYYRQSVCIGNGYLSMLCWDNSLILHFLIVNVESYILVWIIFVHYYKMKYTVSDICIVGDLDESGWDTVLRLSAICLYITNHFWWYVQYLLTILIHCIPWQITNRMTSNPFISINIYISRKVLNDLLHSIQQPTIRHKSPVRYNFTFVFQNFCFHTRIQSNGTDHWLQQNITVQTSHTLVALQKDNCDWCHSVIQT